VVVHVTLQEVVEFGLFTVDFDLTRPIGLQIGLLDDLVSQEAANYPDNETYSNDYHGFSWNWLKHHERFIPAVESMTETTVPRLTQPWPYWETTRNASIQSGITPRPDAIRCWLRGRLTIFSFSFS